LIFRVYSETLVNAALEHVGSQHGPLQGVVNRLARARNHVVIQSFLGACNKSVVALGESDVLERGVLPMDDWSEIRV
jgi:hypothetical protein